MCNYEKMYFTIFNAITDALNEIEKCNFGNAKDILMQAQANGEKQYMDSDQE